MNDFLKLAICFGFAFTLVGGIMYTSYQQVTTTITYSGQITALVFDSGGNGEYVAFQHQVFECKINPDVINLQVGMNVTLSVTDPNNAWLLATCTVISR